MDLHEWQNLLDILKVYFKHNMRRVIQKSTCKLEQAFYATIQLPLGLGYGIKLHPSVRLQNSSSDEYPSFPLLPGPLGPGMVDLIYESNWTVWKLFGLVSLFNGISTLFRLFNAKAILLEEQ